MATKKRIVRKLGQLFNCHYRQLLGLTMNSKQLPVRGFLALSLLLYKRSLLVERPLLF